MRQPVATRLRLLLAGKSDGRLRQLASRSLYRRRLNKGIEIGEYQPQVLHAKLIVVDDIVFGGSSNLDPRSLRINFEIMLRIHDAALAATVRVQFEADLAQARPAHHARPIGCWPGLTPTSPRSSCASGKAARSDWSGGSTAPAVVHPLP